MNTRYDMGTKPADGDAPVANEPGRLLGDHVGFVRMLLDLARSLDKGKRIRVKNAEAYYDEARDDEGARAHLLYISGTNQWADWRDNLKAYLVPRRGMGRLHKGFADHWSRLRQPVLGKLDGRTLPLYIAGHSLGGSVANIAAMDLRGRGYPVKYVITMGAPAAGDEAWQKVYRKAAENPRNGFGSLRFTTPYDWVPRLLRETWGYGHVGKHVGIPYFGRNELDSHSPGNYLNLIESWIRGEKIESPPRNESNFVPVDPGFGGGGYGGTGGGFGGGFSMARGGPVPLRETGNNPRIAAQAPGDPRPGDPLVRLAVGLLPGFTFRPEQLRRPEGVPHASFGGSVHRGRKVNRNASITVNLPPGTPAEHKKMLEEAASAAFRDGPWHGEDEMRSAE